MTQGGGSSGLGGDFWGGGFRLPRLNAFTPPDALRDNPFDPANPPPLNPPPPSYAPPIYAVTYGNYVPINPYTNQPISYPPGTSLAANAAAARSMNAFQYFYAVTHQWNYITQGSAYEPFGNFNAGYTGRANGWPGFAVQIGAGGYQQFMTTTHDPSWGSLFSGPPWGDDPIDQYMIDWGARYYDSGGH